VQEIKAFLRVVDRQYSLVNDLFELDSYYSDFEPDRWQLIRKGARRGWTRRDIELHEQRARLQSINWDFYSAPPSERDNPRRVATGMRILKTLRLSELFSVSKKAIELCESRPHLRFVAPIVAELTQAHKEWLAWMPCQDYGTNSEERRRDLRSTLDGIIETLEQVLKEDTKPETITKPQLKVLLKKDGLADAVDNWNNKDDGFPLPQESKVKTKPYLRSEVAAWLLSRKGVTLPN
jgi:hypothetical protein